MWPTELPTSTAIPASKTKRWHFQIDNGTFEGCIMVIIGADIPTEVMLRALKAALELKRQVAANWLYTTTF